MARASASDPLHSFRFHCKALDNIGFGTDLLQPAGTGPGFSVGDSAEAGFQAVTSPEYTLEHVEYREGTKTYTEKYPGFPTVNDVTMSRGVARRDTAFYDWTVSAIEGADYRTDIAIYHFRRGARHVPFAPATDVSDANAKRYILRNGSPGRVKVAADFDASTGDVSLAEIDVIYERFDVEKDTGDTTTSLKSPADVNLAT